MAHYDSNQFFDSGLRYDSVEAPATPTKKRMAKIRRNWSKLAIGQRIVKCKAVIDGITDNPTVLPNPAPTLVALTALYQAAKDADDLVKEKELELTALRSDSKTKNDAMVAGLNAEASTAEGATAGDATKLLLLNFELTDPPAGSVGELEKVTELTVSGGDNDGELDPQWHPDRDADSFEVQTTATVNDAASWVHRATTTKSKITLTGLPSGTRQWVRVRAIGAAGPGPWSDPVSKMVP